MRITLFFFFISLTTLSFAQKNFSKEISLISDNDLYTSVHRDGYYTNGLFLTYRVIKNDLSNDELQSKNLFIEVEKQKYELELLLNPIKNANFKTI